jgi:hypothetical protein
MGKYEQPPMVKIPEHFEQFCDIDAAPDPEHLSISPPPDHVPKTRTFFLDST